ncbi:MAG TPA: hypothetical protein VN039_09000, partial [Nitrospira sp.]|nr:hypothetical protein [Nitrospira sp.]
YKGYEVLSYVTAANVVVIWISAVVLVLSLFKKLIYRFQVFFSSVMAVMAVGLVYTMCSLSLPIATLTRARGELFYAAFFNIAGLVTVGLLAGATVVHVLLLRRRLRVGHSEKRTIGNYVAVSRANISKMLWINFGVVALVVPNVLTSGKFLLNFIGIIALIVFACVMTSLPVEFAYLAYLKSKDRVYWETPPRGRSKQERLRVAKKAGLWVFGVAAALTLFWVLAKYLPVWLG